MAQTLSFFGAMADYHHAMARRYEALAGRFDVTTTYSFERSRFYAEWEWHSAWCNQYDRQYERAWFDAPLQDKVWSM